MKRTRIYLLSGLLAIILSLALTMTVKAEEEGIDTPEESAVEVAMTITGTVNDNYQIVTDKGEVYDIGVTDAGDELIQYPGKKAEVQGSVIQEGEQNIIYVNSYHIINE